MVDQPHDIQTIGIKEETTEGDDVITSDAVPYYEIGLYNTSWGKFPRMRQEIMQKYKGGSYDPYYLSVSKSEVFGQLTNIPSNGWLNYFMMARAGVGVSSAGGIHTVTGINNGKVAPFTTRWESHNSVNGLRMSALGSRALSYSISLDLVQPDMYLSSIFNFQARRLANSPVQTTYPPVYADAGSFDSQRPYMVDSNFEVLWDVGGDNVNITDYLKGFTYTLDTFNRFGHIKGQKYPKWVLQGNRTHSVSFTMDRTDETSVFDDFLAQPTANVFKDMSFKIYNTSANYQKHNFTDVAIVECDMNHAYQNGGENPVYEIVAVVRNNVMNIKDGVPAALYGV